MNLFKNISVRTFIVLIMIIITSYSFIPILFQTSDELSLKIYNKIPFIILFSTLFFFFYLSVYLVNPISKIQKTLKEITAGKINTKIDLFGNNCAGKLIPEIKKMQESIQSIIEKISNTNNNIYEELSNIIIENKKLKNRTEIQSQNIIKMTLTAKKVNSEFSHNNELSLEAKKIIDNSIKTLNNGKTNMNLMFDNITKVEGQSEDIMNISNFINEISFKTNILALNAAIEASRAGINGRGFSVIAKEIRELSNICQNHAKDIKNIVEITKIQIEETKRLNTLNIENMNSVNKDVQQISTSVNTIYESSKKQFKDISSINDLLNIAQKDVNNNINLSDQNIELSESIHYKIKELSLYVNSIYS